MKKGLTILIVSILCQTALGQVTDTINNTKEKILKDIQVNLDSKAKTIDSTIILLDRRVVNLDKDIASAKSASQKADKLLERVQALEQKQTAIEQTEELIYQANYQSAVINLVSMEREIKPLLLFNTTRKFFTTLSDASNPMNYEGYQAWYGEFNKYIENQKSKEASLNVLSSLITLTGDLSKGAPFTGPITEPLFSGIGLFINSLGKNKKDLRTQSEKMFLLTAKVSQFAHDKERIENEWSLLSEQLNEIQKHYKNILDHNLKSLKIDTNDFKAKFIKQTDADKRYEYLTSLRKESAAFVANTKSANTKEWKENIHFQLMDVQSLKIRFGTVTFNISENIERYNGLIAKYKNDPQVGPKMTLLEIHLNDLKKTFDGNFNPVEYINSATRMYKVY